MRILLAAMFRVGTDAAVLWMVGGRAALAHPVATAWLAAEAIWCTVEAWLSHPERRRMDATPDEHELAFIRAGKRWALASLAYVWVVLAVFAWRLDPAGLTAVPIAGFALYIVGAFVRGGAMAALADRFKSWEVRRNRRGVETRGVYALVRHPSYLGMLLMTVAAPIVLSQWWAVPAAALFAPLAARRVEAEERLLKSVYGAEYERYLGATRARLMPGIW